MIRLSKSNISNKEIVAVTEVMKKEHLGMGEEVKKFELNLSHFFNRKCVCLVNGTAALHLSLQAAGIKHNDEVICPSLTYLASFQAISAVGATPIPCDINLENLTIDILDLKNKITSKTKAIMIVHYAGGTCNIEEVYKIAKKNNLRVIEDAAHAFGSYYKDKLIGSFGDIVCFSFDGIKNITSGEGGCVVSNDLNLLKKIEDLRLLGVINDTENRYVGKRSWSFDVEEQGWRYHMSNLMASIGNVQLSRLNEFSEKRKSLAKLYVNHLSDIKIIKTLKIDYEISIPHIFVIILGNKIDRTSIRLYLHEKGIETGIHYFPNHKLSFYKKSFDGQLKNTDLVSNKILSLPLHFDLNENDIKYVCDNIREYLKEI